jgi:hypothetical protein
MSIIIKPGPAIIFSTKRATISGSKSNKVNIDFTNKCHNTCQTCSYAELDVLFENKVRTREFPSAKTGLVQSELEGETIIHVKLAILPVLPDINLKPSLSPPQAHSAPNRSELDVLFENKVRTREFPSAKTGLVQSELEGEKGYCKCTAHPRRSQTSPSNSTHPHSAYTE